MSNPTLNNPSATDKQILKRYLDIPQPDDKVLATYVKFQILKKFSLKHFILNDFYRSGSMVAGRICVQKQ